MRIVLDAIEVRARGLVLAIRSPREEEQAAADDRDGCSEPYLVPDAVEEVDPEDAESEDSDECADKLEVERHRRESTSAASRYASGGRNAS